MTSLQDEILSVFIDQNTRELKDTDVSIALTRKNIACTPEEVRRQVLALSPELFQLIFNLDKTVSIRVQPTIEICEDFRTTNCPPKQPPCNKLHICRHFVRCTRPKCHFPHEFNRGGSNQRIVTEYRCQNLNAKLLVQLLDLQKSSAQPSAQNGGGIPKGHNSQRDPKLFASNTNLASNDNSDRQVDVGFPSVKQNDQNGGGIPKGLNSQRDKKVSSSNTNLAPNDNSDRQVDVSFPSVKLNEEINMKSIETIIQLHGGKIESKFDENDNNYFRRATFVLQQINDVEKVLAKPSIKLKGADIKFKRTKKVVDKTSFTLKISIDNGTDKIETSRLESYINTLVDKNLRDTILDLSTDNEQIILVQCKCEIDIDKAQQKNLAKPKLVGKDVRLIQIYECDKVVIRSNHRNESITEDTLKRIFHSVLENIFAYNLRSSNNVEVEFITVNALNQWKSSIDSIENKFQVTIRPSINYVDENGTDTDSNGHLSEPHGTTITLREDWELIAGHRAFKAEYKEFIQRTFGGTVDINGDKATYTGTFPKHLQGTRDIVIFGNKTDEFMRGFQCETFYKLGQNQIEILRANANVAYSRIKLNDYTVIARPDKMSELKRQLNSKVNVPPKSPATLTSMYNINTPDRMIMFSIEIFEDRLQRYLQETFHVNLTCEKSNNSIRLKVMGEQNEVKKASDDIDNLFTSLRTKKFDKLIEDAIHVINYHFKIDNMICIGEQINATNVNVYYFDITNPQFGTDENKIEDLVRYRLHLLRINLNQQSISTNSMKDLMDLEESFRQRTDYKETICLSKESNTICLFGVLRLTKEFERKFEQLKNKYNLQPCKITLSEQQLNFLTYVAKTEMNKLEKECKSNGCDVSLKRLRQNCEFLAPVHMHSVIKDKLQALLAQICETSFDIDELGFALLITNEPNRLVPLVASKCYLDKKIDSRTVRIEIPKARVAANVGMRSTDGASANTSRVANVTIGHSTLAITNGDLATQAVDAIVLSTSSELLCSNITRTAGLQVMGEYRTLKSLNNFPNTISGGSLPCKKIILVPWDSNAHDPSALKASLNSFVAEAFKQAVSNECKSIAFPAVGCGNFNHDPSTIAKYMLCETRDQLKAIKSKMNISFVLKDQLNVYDAFVKCLNEMEAIDIAIKVPVKERVHESSISFDRKSVRITLIGGNENDLLKCKEEIENVVRASSTLSHTRKPEMLDWPQDTINEYYDYCLKQQVIPKLDLDETTLELEGMNDGVRECEKYFYQLTNAILGEQRIHALSEGVIWSYQLTPNSDTWEPYSPKINGIIEDASSKRHPRVNFENDQGEKCQIIFSKMEETSPSRTRHVHRAIVDPTLPKTWQILNQNIPLRVTLAQTSPEYGKVLAQFNETMLGKYSQIIKIERIQSESWYKQYAAHRDDFRKRYGNLDERLLFHGCTDTAADQIIEKCFNRSFAGKNGVVYGHGVYFHARASYSHDYALPNTAGERRMFLTRVLIGKTCKGNVKMTVAPTGYDTTTDGEHIFVVYHDAGAYADHLITYK